MFSKIDGKQLETITGGVRPGPNGEGCTQGPHRPGSPRPRPGSTNPVLGGNQTPPV
jgi:hypothetical protein